MKQCDVNADLRATLKAKMQQFRGIIEQEQQGLRGKAGWYTAGQCAEALQRILDNFSEVEDALAHGAAQAPEIPYPTVNTFVFCAHCEHAVLNCPECGRDEWRIERKDSEFGKIVAKQPREAQAPALSDLLERVTVVRDEIERDGKASLRAANAVTETLVLNTRYVKQLDDLSAALRAAQGSGPSDWRPIETLPADYDKPFLVFWRTSSAVGEPEADKVGGRKEYEEILAFGEPPASHWQPLPDPPVSAPTPGEQP